jgi:hypothetical protein
VTGKLPKPAATLSIDLDNLWSYLRAKGDHRWTDYPSFLALAVPRILRLLDELALRATVFVVGRDADCARDRDLLQAFPAAGHELGNHSYTHDPGFHRYTDDALEDDFARSEAALAALGAGTIRGFRGPSFRVSEAVLRTLVRRGYRYDASTFPTCLGPLARAWQSFYFRLDGEAREALRGQYGEIKDARRPLQPYRWCLDNGELIEIPVSTMPFTRLPVHWTYIHFLGSCSPRVAVAYVRTNIALCRLGGLRPSLLLHATDFIGGDDADCPHFLPGMRRHVAAKLGLLRQTLALYMASYDLLPIGDFIVHEVDATRLIAHSPTLTHPS